MKLEPSYYAKMFQVRLQKQKEEESQFASHEAYRAKGIEKRKLVRPARQGWP